MAKAPGRLAVLAKAGTPLASIKMLAFEWNGEKIDVTDKDSNGINECLSVVASQGLKFTVEGWSNDHVFRNIALDTTISKLLTDLTFKHADALVAVDTIAGNFFMNSYKEGSPHDDGVDFSCEFESSGAWTRS
jgi:predicted secreted protein